MKPGITSDVFGNANVMVLDPLYDTKTVLRIYEALRPHYEPKKLIEDISKQADRYGIVYEEKNGEVIAVAFTWHIDDPYDVVDKNWEYPGEKPDGKYVYMPLLWIKESERNYGFLMSFLRKLLQRHHSAKRLAFKRDRGGKPKLKILMRFKNGTAICSAAV